MEQVEKLEQEQKAVLEAVNKWEIPEEIGWQEYMKIQKEIDDFNTRYANIW